MIKSNNLPASITLKYKKNNTEQNQSYKSILINNLFKNEEEE